jgi:hypothetical protein
VKVPVTAIYVPSQPLHIPHQLNSLFLIPCT